MNDDTDETLEKSVHESSKEELKQWKDERIKSLQTPELGRSDNEKKDDKPQEGCKSLSDLGTPTKKSNNSLNNAIKENENLKSKLMYVTKENTSLLQEISKLKKQQIQLDDILKEISANPRDELETSKEDDAEYAKLTEIAKRQRKEIESLKSDIQRLRSKGGHVSKETMLCGVCCT